MIFNCVKGFNAVKNYHNVVIFQKLRDWQPVKLLSGRRNIIVFSSSSSSNKVDSKILYYLNTSNVPFCSENERKSLANTSAFNTDTSVAYRANAYAINWFFIGLLWKERFICLRIYFLIEPSKKRIQRQAKKQRVSHSPEGDSIHCVTYTKNFLRILKSCEHWCRV